MDTYDLREVTVVADAGMIGDANRRDLDAAGLFKCAGRQEPGGAVQDMELAGRQSRGRVHS